MTVYTNVFGGGTIYPAQTGYVSLSLAANTTLSWGFEGDANVVADVIDVTSSAAYDLTLPDARAASPGTRIQISNGGAYTITVKDAAGGVIVSATVGSSHLIYLKTNATAAGTWGSIQAGAVSSTAQASALQGYGLVALSNTLNLKMETFAFAATTTAGLTDRAKVFNWTGGSGTLNLPSASTMTNNWFMGVKNNGAGTLTVTPASGTIDGAASLALSPNDSFLIVHDGTNYLTLGRGRTLASSIDYIAINVAGSGDYTLSTGQQNKVIYRFTGLLTGARAIIVPASVQQYWIDNATTGAYTLTVKPAAGSGVAVAQGQKAILYCDGANVVAATASVTTPLAVADGGTGATTADNALINLGGTSIGRTLFKAANEAAVRTALALTVGTDVQAYDSDLAALAANATNGLWARTGAGTGAARTLTGTANEITVANGDGASGNPTLSLPAALTFTSKTVTGGTFASPILSGTVTGTYTLAGTPTLTSPTITNATMTAPALGTPASGVLTNCTGLPLATGVSGTLAVANGGTGSTNDVKVATIQFVIDGGGLAITTGVKGDITIPFGCTINDWTLLADASGSIVIDVWKDSYANYPPTVADTITAAAKPTLSAATKNTSSTLTGWTTSMSAGDTLRFNVDSAATVTRVTLALKVTRT